MSERRIEAELAGTVCYLPCAKGDSVAAGDPLVVVESMKMEFPIVAPTAGTVSSVLVALGEQVDAGDVVAIITSP